MDGDERDEVLVLRARAGDREAFAALLDRHRTTLAALCTRMLRDPHLAEDATHEAVLQALLSLARLRRPDSFGPWLCGIGLNVCRRWLREQARPCWSWEALCGGRYVAFEPADFRAGPDEIAEEADLANRVRQAVQVLPPGQRAAILLFYLMGLTYAETASLLGIEVSAVKTRLNKARKTLRQQLWTVWKEEYMETTAPRQAVEMRVIDVRRFLSEEAGKPPMHVVELEELNGGRRLYIWVGRAEGEAIALLLEKVETPRPLTFTFMANLLEASGGRVREVRVTTLAEEVFYATVGIEAPSGINSIDARPSDALTLALATGAPIRVEPEVLEKAAVAPGDDSPRVKELPSTGEGVAGAKEIAEGIKLGYPAPR